MNYFKEFSERKTYIIRDYNDYSILSYPVTEDYLKNNHINYVSSKKGDWISIILQEDRKYHHYG